jgi:hypothetical protein
LQLLDDVQNAASSLALRARSDVLPPQQETDEILRGHRLDRATALAARVRVNPCEQAPSAELVGFRIGPLIEGSAQCETLELEARERDLDQSRRQRGGFRQSVG